MNKLITSLACGTVISMSIMGASYASSGVGSAALGGIPEVTATMDGSMGGNMGNNRMMNNNDNWMNGTTGTMNKNESIMKDKIRTNDNNYRPNGYSTNNNNNNQRNNNWDNYTNGYIWDNTNTNTNSNVSPMANVTPAGRYRANNATTDNNDRGSNWGWLGLFGLLGLLGMRSRSSERSS